MNNLLEKVRSFSKNDIVKVFSLTSISTLVRMLTGMISVKVVASIIGPVGVALVGQLNNFSTMLLAFSGGGINSGITKYIAECRNDDQKVKRYLSTALRITIVCSACAGILLIVLSDFLSQYVMLSPDYGYVFIVFGFTIMLYALNAMLASVINGFKEFKKYVSINIAGTIIGLIYTVLLVYFWGLDGALVGAVTFQSIMLFVSIWMMRKLPWAHLSWFKEKFDKVISKQYFGFSLMTLVAAIASPLSLMLMRGYVISEISAVEAGWWEGMNRISNMYLSVITSSLGVYYLPRMSELSNIREWRAEIVKAYKLVIPLMLCGFLVVYFIRLWVIQLLFTPDFYPMENMFSWQLVGDFLKICSWLLAYNLLAKSMIKLYVFSEILFVASKVALSFLFMHWNGTIGLVQAYFVNYILYLLFMLYVFRKQLFSKSVSFQQWK